ncbi:helix-turn-helix transcriptional regulator [Bradyrhizobium cajani]|uniref:Helix-turn-helix domain-containing protein n=1 Tax=Bradyrhizobium cajani TaxID=1928661 RepID=A0A844TTP8_9BRAD|nr:helix-turn-helix transcriptional regulator [Bradyrhizobium cajani]MCP3374596.1 helix-turn-helix transcriptional regulator [Bradyrhizobium cajani]MVT78000.1 helix-turn-helix domain-containing protein [Bradyrhizobium cajani]
MADPRRVEFGDFLRSRREKLSPKTVGLPAGRRRRTAGLRREEVAQLAGIGVDWYIRLEQGRTVSPSVTTVDALARALRLSKAEHAHLKALARDGDKRAFTREIVPPPILRLIESLPHPAYITGRRWDVLAWNAAAEAVFAFGRLPEEDRNTMLLMMTNRQTRKAYGANWAEVAKRMVAMFRASHDVWAGDPAFTELLTRLRQGSPEFVKWWEAHEIRSTASGLKTMSHPTLGVLHFEHTSFQANDDPALKLVIYTPVRGGGA